MAATYSYRPRPLGGSLDFQIEDRHLVIDAGRRIDRVPWTHVKSVRIAQVGSNLSRSRIDASLALSDGRRVRVSNISWRSFTAVEDRNAAFCAFMGELLSRAGKANPALRCEAGKPLPVWLAMLATSCACVLAIVLFAYRAYEAGARDLALLALAIALGSAWLVWPLTARNRPRSFSPDKPPSDLLTMLQKD